MMNLDRLSFHENIKITPNISADNVDVYIQLTLGLFFRNMQRYLSSDGLLNPVRPELGY